MQPTMLLRAFGVTDGETFATRMPRDVPPRPPRAAELRAIDMGATLVPHRGTEEPAALGGATA